MLQDDAGELSHIKLDPGLVSSDSALIVLDEYNDTCWVWIGRSVSMPTRMHALRMSKSLQKTGYSVGATTIGMSLTHLIEIMEKDEGEPDVAMNITNFKELLNRKWSFDDGILAYDPAQAISYEAKPVEIIESRPSTTPPPDTSTAKRQFEVVAKDVEPAPRSKTTLKVTTPSITAEKKAAYLLYATVKNTDIVYVEKIERNGIPGYRIEAPGIMVIEALLEGNNVSITPSNFGDSEQSQDIKRSYESWLKRV